MPRAFGPLFPARQGLVSKDRDIFVMRVTIERTSFLRALNHVQSVVERRNTIPILSNVLIQAAGGNLRLTATDLDIEIVETVAAEVGKEGAATVPAHMLYDIVRKLPEGPSLNLNRAPMRAAFRYSPASRASRCRPCRRRISPISPAANWPIHFRSPLTTSRASSKKPALPSRPKRPAIT